MISGEFKEGGSEGGEGRPKLLYDEPG